MSGTATVTDWRAGLPPLWSHAPGLGVALSLTVLAAAVSTGDSRSAALGIAAWVVGFAAYVYRVFGVSISAAPDRLIVRNLVRSKGFAPGEIDRIDFGPFGAADWSVLRVRWPERADYFPIRVSRRAAVAPAIDQLVQGWAANSGIHVCGRWDEEEQDWVRDAACPHLPVEGA